jgi:hypothetical protein
MAATVVGTPTTYGNASSAAATLSKPTGVADGELLVAFVELRTSTAGTWTLPTGWTSQVTNTTNHQWLVATKPIPTASAESAGSYVFTNNQAASRMAAAMFRVSGADATTPIDAIGVVSSQAFTTSPVLPAVTAVAATSLLLAFGAYVQQTSASVSSWTADAAMTQVVQVTGGTAGTAASVGIQVASQAITSAGSTGTRGPTVSPAPTNSGGVMLTIKPAGVAPPPPPPSTVVMSDDFTGSIGQPFAGDSVYTNLAGTAPTFATNGNGGKALRFAAGGQGIIQETFAGTSKRIFSRIYRLSAPVTVTSEVAQGRIGTARGPALSFRAGNVIGLLKTDGSASNTGTVALPVGVDFRVTFVVDGVNLTAYVFPDTTTTTAQESLAGLIPAAVSMTAFRDGIVTAGALGGGVSLDVSWPVDDSTGEPGPRSYPAYGVNPAQANAGTNVIGAEPGETRTLAGTDLAGTNAITARAWSQVANGAPTVTVVGSGTTATYTTPVASTASSLLFRYTVTASDGAVSSDVNHTVLAVVERTTATNPVQFRLTPSVAAGVSSALGLTRTGGTLYHAGVRFRMAGANMYWLGLDDNAGVRYPTHADIDAAVAFCTATGINYVRSHTLGFSFGSSMALITGYNQGTDSFAVNTSAWDSIDYAAQKFGAAGIYLELPLCDQYGYYHGGKRDIVSWLSTNNGASINGVTPTSTDRNVTVGNSGTEKVAEQQFYNNTACVTLFKKYIALRLNHVNTYTGVSSKNNPGIIWSLGNELWDVPQVTNRGWTQDIASYIKSLSPSNLVDFGGAAQGVKLADYSGHPGLTAAAVDIVGTHLYTQDASFNPAPFDLTQLDADVAQASGASKAFTIGEYAWSRSNRDAMLDHVVATPAITGTAFWSYIITGETHGSTTLGTDDVPVYYPASGTNSAAISTFLTKLAAHATAVKA